MALQYLAGAPQNIGPGPNVNQGGGPQGDAWFSEYQPRFGTLARQGKILKYAAAVTLAHITTSTAQTFALINPSGSGYNAEFLWTSIGFTTGTTVVGSITWSLQNASTYPPTSLTAAAPWNANPNFGVGVVVPYSAATTTSTAPNYYWDLVLTTPTTTTVYGQQLVKYHDGSLILPPGYVAYLGQVTAAAAAGTAEVAWIEVPIAASLGM